MSTQYGSTQPTGAAGQAAGAARDEAAQTAGTARDEAAQTAQTAKHAATQTAQTAQQEAAHVGTQAVSAASDVVGTTKEQVSHVAGEALDQVRDLTDQVRTQLSEQASSAGQKLAQALRSIAEELQQMSEHPGEHGAASQAARSLAERGHRYAEYLEGREPESVVSDLRGSAARRPGGFLLGAMVAGVLTGRFVRGGRAAAQGSAPALPSTPVGGTYSTPVSTGYVPVPVAAPVGQSTYTDTSFSMPAATPGAEPIDQSFGRPYPDPSGR